MIRSSLLSSLLCKGGAIDASSEVVVVFFLKVLNISRSLTAFFLGIEVIGALTC